MRYSGLPFLGITVLCLIPTALYGADQPTEGAQVEQKLEVSVPVTMNYLLALPKDYESKEKWPLLLFLHGAGERGDNLEQVKRHGPPKLIAAGKELPFIVVSPQCPANRRWESIELTALLDEIVAKYNVDEDRVYVTGLSMGGFGTWSLATHSPNRFAAIAPICGGGETFMAKSIAKLPVWAFHGEKDSVVPPVRSTEMIDAIKAAGGDPKLTLYPELFHDSWTITYDNPELYTWLLEHTRDAE